MKKVEEHSRIEGERMAKTLVERMKGLDKEGSKRGIGSVKKEEGEG